MKRIFSQVLLSCLVIAANAQTIHVSDYGIKPNTFEDATESIQKAIEACRNTSGATLTFPKGRYDFWPEKAEKREYYISNTSSETDCPSKIKNIGILLEGIKNLTIEGNGSLFVFHGKMITWALDHCENIKIHNLSVDFERPSMTELTIDELYPDKLIASVHPDSRYTIIDGKVRFYGEGWGMNGNYFSILTDTIQGTCRYSSWSPLQESKVTEIAPFKLKFENDFSSVNYKAGQTITTRDHIRDHVGVFVNNSRNITLEDLNFHYMHGLGIVSQFSEDLTYKAVNIIPLRGRTIAAFADGMHFSGCKGHIEIQDCRFRGLHDDPINVHGTYLKIVKTNPEKDKLTLRFMHPQTYGMQAFFTADSVAFVQSSTLRKAGYAIVKDTKRISEREMEIVLDRPLPKDINEGDCLENITWTPSLRVSGCRMEMTNTRGLLVSTPRKVIIENNYFYRTGMYAILIAADANSWYESGAVNDILIRNNVFDGCGYNLYHDNNNYTIAVEPENHVQIKNYRVHHNIRIENNTFKVYDNDLVIKARSTETLCFRNNVIDTSEFIPDLKGKTIGASFKFDDCTKVKIENNKISNLSIECTKMKKNDIEAGKDYILNLK